MQERHDSSVLGMELRLSCINPSISITGPNFAFNKWTYPVLSFNYINNDTLQAAMLHEFDSYLVQWLFDWPNPFGCGLVSAIFACNCIHIFCGTLCHILITGHSSYRAAEGCLEGCLGVLQNGILYVYHTMLSLVKKLVFMRLVFGLWNLITHTCSAYSWD